MVLYYCYRRAFSTASSRGKDILSAPLGSQYDKVKEEISQSMREMAAIPYEQVYTKSHDGLRLAARYYHVRDGAPVQIQFHGYRSSGLCDFSGGTMLARKIGHNVLVVDQRGHGLSEGKHLTFGIEEKNDCISWINYVIDRFGKEIKIFLVGVSMGASTVLLASGLTLPDNVVGIIADSPYNSPEDIIKKVCCDMKLSPKLAYPAIELAAKVYMKCNLREGDVCAAVKKASMPILLIHGEDDRFVPCEMSEEILKSCPEDTERVTFKNAGHVLSYIADPIKYEKCINDFIKKCLNLS